MVPSPDIAAVRQKTAGPSAPGQVCAERVFVFKIACVAQACTTERFRDTQECIEFKEMEKVREEQRNNVR